MIGVYYEQSVLNLRRVMPHYMKLMTLYFENQFCKIEVNINLFIKTIGESLIVKLI